MAASPWGGTAELSLEGWAVCWQSGWRKLLHNPDLRNSWQRCRHRQWWGNSKERSSAGDWNKGRRSWKLHLGVSAVGMSNFHSWLGAGDSEGFYRRTISSSELCSAEIPDSSHKMHGGGESSKSQINSDTMRFQSGEEGTEMPNCWASHR